MSESQDEEPEDPRIPTPMVGHLINRISLAQAGKKKVPRYRTVGGTLGIVRNWEALFFNCLIKLPILDIECEFLRCAWQINFMFSSK